LTGKGFEQVYNVSGGIKAWNSKTAYGSEEFGLELFSGQETPEENLIVAYSLEAGLHDFYVSMTPKVNNADAKNLFQKLSDIEVRHQDYIFDEYLNVVQDSLAREAFEKKIVIKFVEGGLSTEEYLKLFKPDLNSIIDITEMAMSIEAQALDLYLRASIKSTFQRSKSVLNRIAEEEKSHLAQLGKLIDRTALTSSLISKTAEAV